MRAPFVTVVSGAPRSGTSLAMQMLRAGGMSVLADDERPADPDNPRGYLEYGPVKRTASDARWVGAAAGRAVKVIYVLLHHLPRDREYRVLWMRRPAAAVVASQERMLRRLGAEEPDPLPPVRLAAVLDAQLAQTEVWLAREPAFRVLGLDTARVVADPGAAAAAIDAFLGGGLDRAAMAAAVEPALYGRGGGDAA
jgi:hypothetical protein